MTSTPPTLPTGTVTFFRTDVEGSMALARRLGSGWDELNTLQLGIIRWAIEGEGGVSVRTEGDALFGAFPQAPAAIRAAIAAQRALATHTWPDDARVRVRIGLHTGEAHLAGDDYGGFDVNRAARVAAVGHGGQIVLSDPTRALIETDLPDGVALRDLGRHALKDVPQPERLFQLDVPGLASDFPPIRTGATVTGNLPPRLTSFLGRERELADLEELLRTTRLLTITGPGGIGKTSLAIELARSMAAEFPDGTWFVPLDTVADAAVVPTAVARTLGLYDGPDRSASDGLASHFADRSSLLVLDNFEQVLEAAGEVAALLRAAPGLRVVVTSRAPLRIGGEQDYPVGPLSVREADDPGIRLFVERARSVRPSWAPSGEEAEAVREACARLDGLPLGIELAAARCALLPPAAIRDRLAARLPLPGSGPRDAPERQRTLESAIAWSYDLLTPAGQRLLREMAVFDGGFDLDQARVVAEGRPRGDGDVLDGLIELADQSLIQRDAVTGPGSGLGSLRFVLLETVRTFALRALADSGAERHVRKQHAQAFVTLAEEAARHWLGSEQGRWLDRLAEDHANLHSALEWSIANGEAETAQRLSAALWRYWQFGGQLREGRALADAVIEMPQADEPRPTLAWALGAAGGMAYWQAETPRAQELYQRQLDAARQVGDLAGEADALYNLASTWFIGGDFGRSTKVLDEARDAYLRIGDEIGAARTEWGRWNAVSYADEAEEAIDRLEELRSGYEARGDVMYVALAAGSLAFAHLARGNLPEAMRWALVSLASQHAMRDVAGTTISLGAVAIGLLVLGRPDEAATVHSAYEALCEVGGVRPPAGLGFVLAQARLPERVLEAFDDHTAYRDAVERGRQMSLDQAVAYIFEVMEPPDPGAGPADQPRRG